MTSMPAKSSFSDFLLTLPVEEVETSVQLYDSHSSHLTGHVFTRFADILRFVQAYCREKEDHNRYHAAYAFARKLFWTVAGDQHLPKSPVSDNLGAYINHNLSILNLEFPTSTYNTLDSFNDFRTSSVYATPAIAKRLIRDLPIDDQQIVYAWFCMRALSYATRQHDALVATKKMNINTPMDYPVFEWFAQAPEHTWVTLATMHMWPRQLIMDINSAVSIPKSWYPQLSQYPGAFTTLCRHGEHVPQNIDLDYQPQSANISIADLKNSGIEIATFYVLHFQELASILPEYSLYVSMFTYDSDKLVPYLPAEFFDFVQASLRADAKSPLELDATYE